MSDAFDWPALLSRVNGNVALARRLLEGFFAEHGALAEAEGADLRNLVHRIGGSAGNLALIQVAEAARDSEAMLLRQPPPTAEHWRAALVALQERIGAAQAQVQTVLAALPTVETTTGGDSGDVLATRLAALLDQSDLAALSVAEQWWLAVPRDAHNDAIITAVRGLDFSGAALLLAGKGNGHD
ncbi:Hpt domain-containing protein [Magnetospirillum gryphiswaldense]|nr:Hpt domain-containing protein [Magnetospirillum gryphiswaldense]AVM74048.1 hypothetical protein MSR1_15560 [Magnetospirillum gryphiswaldense MSR-1]AVM77951.1 hypothetical protein MSR1L_15560 [Magnetospirillum gryphiswaldense]